MALIWTPGSPEIDASEAPTGIPCTIYTPTASFVPGVFAGNDKIFRVYISPRGEGKCHAPGTPVLMADGRIKAVEHVHIGDQVMGMDSTPRNVLALHHGHAPMVKIAPIKGDPFVVTDDHLVTLKRTTQRHIRNGVPIVDRKYGELIEVPAKTLQTKSPNFFNTYRLIRTGVEFPAAPVPIDPYFIGLWLGDGHTAGPRITTADPEIVRYLQSVADLWKLRLQCSVHPNNRSSSYGLSRPGGNNPLYQAMHTLGLVWSDGRHQAHGRKRIPSLYLHNSRAIRLQVLAGLIDSDGWTNHGGYQIIQKQEVLADDIVYLARSLGLAAYKAQRTKHIRARGFSGIYHWVGISGDCAGIPVKLPHKRVASRALGWKDVLCTGIQSVTDVGMGEYYGFVLDGDHRFLMGDFTVQHNTTGAYMTFIRWARLKPPSRWPLVIAVVRDTRRNIGKTVARTIKKWSKPGVESWWYGKEDEPERCIVRYNGAPLLELWFFGCNSAQDLSNFQSFECDGLWIEEPAPAADISGGVSVDVMVAATSMRRGEDALVVVSLNPPDENHWTAYFWQLPGFVEPDWTDEQREDVQWIRERSVVCIVPPGENPHLLNPDYRELNLRVLRVAGRHDLVNRLVYGLVGNVQVGEPVTPEYGPQFEVTAVPPVRPGDRLLMSWDPQTNPSCVLWRPSPGGACDILAAWQGLNMGIQQLIERTIQPWMALHIPVRYQLIHTGDPNMTKAESSNSLLSATKVILQCLGSQGWVSGPSSREERRLPVHALLNRYQNGKPWLRIVKAECRPLVKALAGGWHYRKDPSGRVMTTEWIKNAESDIGEAFAYGAAYLYNRHNAEDTFEKHRKKMSQLARDHRDDHL